MKIEQIINHGIQSRSEINEETVKEYAEAMNEGAAFPPITVFRDHDIYYLADGFHRIAAAKSIGRTEIDAEIVDGNYEDALRFALKANAYHGFRRTNADKHRALEIAWQNRKLLFPGKSDHEISSRQLAAISAVSQEFSRRFLKLAKVTTVVTPLAEVGSVPDKVRSVPGGVSTSNSTSLDRLGRVVPAALLPAFDRRPYTELMRNFRVVKDQITRHFSEGVPAFAAMSQLILIDLENVETKIKESRAFCVCPMCRGERCYRCQNRGYLTKKQYHRLPEEWR